MFQALIASADRLDIPRSSIQIALEGQLDVAPHREAATVARSAVGSFHQAWPAAGDDGEATAGELRGKFASRFIHWVRRPHACRTKKGHRRAHRSQGIEPFDELGLDPEYAPWIGLQKLGKRRPLEQRAVLGWPF